MYIGMCYKTEEEFRYFSRQLEMYYENFSIDNLKVKMYTCVHDIIYDIENKHHFDVVFFGMEKQEESLLLGIKIKQLIKEVLLIYVGQSTRFAPKALELGAFRYVIMDHKFGLSDALYSAVKEAKKINKHHYIISTSRYWVKIPCVDILYCYKSGKMSVIVTEKTEYKERIPLYQLYDKLKDLSNEFIMIERGEIVSISKIKSIEKNMVYLTGNIKLPVGRTYISTLRSIASSFK